MESERRQWEQGILDGLGRQETKHRLQQFTQPFRELMSCYRCAAMEVETKFNVLNEELSLQYDRNPIEAIKTRIKAMESIIDKLGRKGLEVTLDNIENHLYDVAGIRVICSFPSDIYMLEEAFLNQDDVRLVRRKDYISQPKENGYRSLHLIVAVPIFLSRGKRLVKAEVQIRTIAMDSWASLEHQLRYKKNFPLSPEQEKELKLCAELSCQMDERMEMLRRGIFGEQCALGPGHGWK